ncbi:MAG TPA: hypothetical protein DCM67_05720, partial [Propionibacteriaceae bacterium]|nr:hypothetical protein [Propionibacteriaceae bacterium]
MRTFDASLTTSRRGQKVRYGLLWVGLIIIVYTLGFFFLQHRLYHGLHMQIWDLGLFNQVLHNTLHGKVLQYSIPGGSVSLFYERLQIIVLLLIPLYAIV